VALKFKSSYKTLYLLLSISLIWCFLIFFSIDLWSQNSIYVDCSTYLKAAQLLVYDFQPHQWRPLGMAIYATIPGALGQDYQSVFTFVKPLNILLWLICISLVYSILLKLVDTKTAFFGGLIFMSCIGLTVLNNLLLSEIPWLTCMLIGIYGLVKYKNNNSIPWLSIGIASIILSIEFRPISKFIILVLILIYGVSYLKSLASKSRFIVAAVAIIILGHCSLMKHEYGNFTVSYIDTFTLQHYFTEPTAFARSNYTDRKSFEDDWMAPYFSLSYPNRRDYAMSKFLDELKENPLGLVKIYIANQTHNLTTPSLYVHDAKNINKTAYFNTSKVLLLWGSKLQNIVFTLLGIASILSVLILALRRKLNFKEDQLLLFITLSLSYTLSVIGISAEQYDRLNVPNYALIIILAVLVWSKINTLQDKNFK
jgi:hypothetical protein